MNDIINNYNTKLELVINTENPSIRLPIYIINLKKDYYRRCYIKTMTKRLNINYTLVIVDEINDELFLEHKNKCLNKGVVGCYLSHMWTIKHAISKGDSYFIIMEDDVIFHKNFIKLFNSINYDKYDMLQMGCCDFNLKKNTIMNPLDNDDWLTIYNPTHLALGAYGNIYNINFAKLLYQEKIKKPHEFDDNFDMYYNKYNIGVCLPNLLTAELSTTNLGHNFSVFSECNDFFMKQCFYNFKYSNYLFVWIIFIEHCHLFLKDNKLNEFNEELYETSIRLFANTYKDVNVIEILNNNNITYNDINTMISNIEK